LIFIAGKLPEDLQNTSWEEVIKKGYAPSDKYSPRERKELFKLLENTDKPFIYQSQETFGEQKEAMATLSNEGTAFAYLGTTDILAPFTFGQLSIRAVRMGMAGSLAYELHGNLEDAYEIYDAIYQAGEPFGIRRLGWHTYMMIHSENGFPQWGYHFDLDMPFPMNAAKILGSGGDKINLRNPYELGWGFGVKFDHDFVGREALEKIAANQVRTTVTLEWNAEDIADVYKSQFEDGEPYKEFDKVNDHLHFKEGQVVRYQDKVLDGAGNLIGLSTGRAYSVYYKRMFSQCQIDLAYAKEGTRFLL